MAISRRQFLKRTGVATAGALFGPSFFSNPFLRSAMAATIGDRYFITLFLDGGNDGLNTVIPVTNGSTVKRVTAGTAEMMPIQEASIPTDFSHSVKNGRWVPIVPKVAP